MAGPSGKTTLRRGPPSGPEEVVEFKGEVRVGGQFVTGNQRRQCGEVGKPSACLGHKSKIC